MIQDMTPRVLLANVCPGNAATLDTEMERRETQGRAEEQRRNYMQWAGVTANVSHTLTNSPIYLIASSDNVYDINKRT